MDGTAAPGGLPKSTVDLSTLVSAIQNAVQAQNRIATNIAALAGVISIAFPAPLTSSATWNPGNIAPGGSDSTTVAVSGAVDGDYVQASFSLDLQSLTLTGYVSAADVVTVVLANNTAGAVDLGSGTVAVRVVT